MEPDQTVQQRAALAAALRGLPQNVQNAIRPNLGLNTGQKGDFVTNTIPLNNQSYAPDNLEIRPPIMGYPATGPQLLNAPQPSPYRNISLPQSQPFGFGTMNGYTGI